MKQAPDRRRSEQVDRVLIHPVAGLFLFLLIMFVMFQALFAWADPIIGLVDGGFLALGDAVKRALPEGLLASVLADGLVAGVGAVVTFLPQILLLFFFLGLLEDSGYMARVAYLMDRIMRSMNLHGRAFVPILSGFACAVPAIMATRTMERRRDRLLTMMVVPLTTCSARLPVYTPDHRFPVPVAAGAGDRADRRPADGLHVRLRHRHGAAGGPGALARRSSRSRRGGCPSSSSCRPIGCPGCKDVVHMMWERSRLFLHRGGHGHRGLLGRRCGC